MSEANSTIVRKQPGAAKPRPSLLSAKQTELILKPEDQSEDDSEQSPSQLTAHNDYPKIMNFKDQRGFQPSQDALVDLNDSGPERGVDSNILGIDARDQQEDKTNISKEDLLRLLSILKSELQSKEIALAAIKCEQLKRLINPVEISRSSLANTYMELQDRFKLCDQNNNKRNKNDSNISSSQLISASEQADDMKRNNDEANNDRESLNILNTLLELLDRHPLLALPRDSIYCLDYNCNELSTKNYLNLKIQHLDDLIIQHRRFRYYMNETLKRYEQSIFSLTRELEIAKKAKIENENLVNQTSAKSTLLKHISQLKENLEKEKSDRHTIVMTLLNELLDEREKSEALTKELAELSRADQAKQLSNKTDCGDDRTQEISSLQDKMSNLSSQMTKQTISNENEKAQLVLKLNDLESENAKLKEKLNRYETNWSSTAKNSQNNPDSGQLSEQANSSKPTIVRKTFQLTKRTPVNTPAVARSSSTTSSALATKPLNPSQKASPKPRVPAKPAQLLDHQRFSG